MTTTITLARLRATDGCCRHCGHYGRRWCWYPIDDATYHVLSFTECCSAACYRCKFDMDRCPEHARKGA